MAAGGDGVARQAELRRIEGNVCFKKARLGAAIDCYTEARHLPVPSSLASPNRQIPPCPPSTPASWLWPELRDSFQFQNAFHTTMRFTRSPVLLIPCKDRVFFFSLVPCRVLHEPCVLWFRGAIPKDFSSPPPWLVNFLIKIDCLIRVSSPGNCALPRRRRLLDESGPLPFQAQVSEFTVC